MATTMEQRAKFRELRTSGISRDEAQTQAYGNITPVVPTNAPVAPAPDINSDANRLARLQASGGSPTAIKNLQNPAPVAPSPTTPATPDPMVQAPVDPNTGLSKPLEATQAPVAQPVAETPKVDPTPGINPTTYAQANAESEKIKAQNQAVMDQNKQQSDLRQTETATANANKTAEALKLKQEQESQLASNEGAILNILRTGGIVPEAVKSSPYYHTAQQTYNKLQQYANYSTGDIVTAMNNGSILPGTTLYNEMMKYPALKQKLTDANIYRSGKPTNEVAIYETKSSEILANNPQTASMFADGLITKEEYAQATNNADIVAKAKDKEEKTNKYNTLYADYESIDDKVKADFPGSPFADAIAADIKKAKYKDVILAKGEMDSAIGTLTDLKAQSASLFETNLKLYESRRAEQRQIAGEQRQVQAQKDMLQYKSEFEKKQAEQALNDPATAIQTAIDEYKKLGIPFTSTVQSRLAEFKASGKPLPEYLTQMRENIQKSPAYQKYQSLQNGQLSDAQKVASSQAFEMKKLGIEQDFQMKLAKAKQTTDNKWTKLDDGLYTNDSGEIITADELKAAKLTNNGYISKPVGAEGGECGFYASRGTGMTSTPGGNSKEARVQAFSDKTPEVGGMAFFGGSGYDKTYGHISIVTGINADGTINVKDSNYAGDKTVKERTVPASSVTGYYNSTPLASSIKGGTQGTGTQGTQYTDSNIELLAELANMDASARNTALKAQGIPLKAVTDYMAEAKAGRIPATESQKQSATQIISSIQDLASMDWNDATGVNFSMMDEAPSGSDWATAQSKINNLVASITLPNLGMLKGPMSDKDLAFIQNASSKLAMTQSDSEFQKQLIELYNISARKAGLAEITDLSKIPSGRIIPRQQPVQPQGNTNTGVGQISPEAQSIKNEWLNR